METDMTRKASEALRIATDKFLETPATNKHVHEAATRFPRLGYEHALFSMIAGIAEYIDTCWEKDGWRIAQDGVIGDDGVGAIIGGIQRLLDGQCGRYDCGTLWSTLDRIAMAAGWAKGLEFELAEIEND